MRDKSVNVGCILDRTTPIKLSYWMGTISMHNKLLKICWINSNLDCVNEDKGKFGFNGHLPKTHLTQY